MTVESYIKDYCNGNYKVFREKQDAGVIVMTGVKFAAFHDITTYKDTENGVTFEDRFYIGD